MAPRGESVQRALRAPSAREGERETAPRADFADHGQVASHSLRHLAADRETQAGTILGPRQFGVHLHERLEDAFEIARRDSASSVRDDDVDSLTALLLTGDRDRAARIGELDRIGEQIEDDLLNLLSVRADR